MSLKASTDLTDILSRLNPPQKLNIGSAPLSGEIRDSKTVRPTRFKCTFSVDNTFVIKSWDSNMERLCHKPAHSVIGSKLNKIFPATLYEKVALVFVEGKRKQVKNFQNICFLGTDLTADIQMNPVKDRKGKVKEVSIVIKNISGKCPLDKTLSESEKMIAIGKVASTLAHGIRNPLNAIKGAVVYLNEKYGKELTLKEFSKIINDEIDRLDNFISNFLSSARGGTEVRPTNLNEIIRSILIMIRPKTELQNITISEKFSPLPDVMVDRFQTEQAFFQYN
jgi:two-component system nitrogen regulation sensor histidine kinase GlnL